jgi:hypothetical protein
MLNPSHVEAHTFGTQEIKDLLELHSNLNSPRFKLQTPTMQHPNFLLHIYK